MCNIQGETPCLAIGHQAFPLSEVEQEMEEKKNFCQAVQSKTQY